LHHNIPENSFDIPYTISLVVKYREMFDNFLELPKDKRPPENIWFEPQKLEDWFDDVFDRRNTSNTISFDISEVES